MYNVYIEYHNRRRIRRKIMEMNIYTYFIRGQVLRRNRLYKWNTQAETTQTTYFPSRSILVRECRIFYTVAGDLRRNDDVQCAERTR